MKTLNETITIISEDFLEEAKKSISLIEDMAAMERYMAESYSGRIFIELIQNADDCQSTKIALKQIGNDLYFANNGTPFCSEDIISISRSGSSMKKRGNSIGYRGIGFKSTTALSDEIYIYSDNACFSFSKIIAAKKLGLQTRQVPTVRIPFLIDKINLNIENEIQKFILQGYTTVFIFKNADVKKIADEIKEFSSDSFIFLRTIQECVISIKDCLPQEYIMKRRVIDDVEYFSIKNENWRILRSKSAALAFKEEAGEIVNCSDKEAVYHCFLPTLDKSPFEFKINADFSTDPSRKHIVNDDVTESALNDLVSLMCKLVANILSGKSTMDTKLLSLLQGQKNFSVTNQKLINKFKQKIMNIKIMQNNGEEIPIEKYRKLPEWLEPQEKNIIRIYSNAIRSTSLPTEVYKNNYQVEEFFSEYSSEKYTNEELIGVLEDKILLEKLPQNSITKISARIIKKASLSQKLYGKKINIKSAFQNIESTKNGSNILKDLCNELNDSELMYVNENAGLKLKKEKVVAFERKNLNKLFEKKLTQEVKSSKPKVSKWRSAEQRVVQIEEYLGNSVKDVSKMNVGYDIESITSNEEKRYIEVKSVNSNNIEFSITNNEYTAAHQYGEQYYICLVFEDKAIYIQDPIKRLVFTKRIRQWEWVCDEYCGVEISFDVE